MNLFIDTSTERGLVAAGNTRNLSFVKELPFGLHQSKHLIPILQEALLIEGFFPLGAIGVAVGPGSYTGIRVGAAIAQALAYSWKIPLVGIPSTESFIPNTNDGNFAVLFDARIGGVYIQIGEMKQGKPSFQSPPRLASIEEAGTLLKDVSHVVTPFAKQLVERLKHFDPENRWTWEERAPSAEISLSHLENEISEGKIIVPPERLELLYLRATEAERQKKASYPDLFVD